MQGTQDRTGIIKELLKQKHIKSTNHKSLKILCWSVFVWELLTTKQLQYYITTIIIPNYQQTSINTALYP